MPSELVVCAFVVPGTPVPKARPRTFWDRRIMRRVSKTPERTAAAEQHIAASFRLLFPGFQPVASDIGLLLRSHFAHGAPGDADNYQKLGSDALNTRAFTDDRQVKLLVGEVYEGSDEPRVEICVFRLDSRLRLRFELAEVAA